MDISYTLFLANVEKRLTIMLEVLMYTFVAVYLWSLALDESASKFIKRYLITAPIIAVIYYIIF